MKQLGQYLRYFIIGVVFAFVIIMTSSFIASIFTGYKPDEIINLCGDSFIGLFGFLFPIYYVYKCSKDIVNPASKISTKYVLLSSIAAITLLMVIYVYTTERRFPRNTSYIENFINNWSKQLDLCEFSVKFPGKVKEREVSLANGYVINSYSSADNIPPLCRAECVPLNLNLNNANIKEYIKLLLESQAKNNNIITVETSFESSEIGETGRLIGKTLRKDVEGVFVMKIVVGKESVLLLYASEFKANYPSPEMVKFMENITSNVR